MNIFFKYTLAITLFTTPLLSNAQDFVIGGRGYKIEHPEAVVGSVFYDFTYLKDTTQPSYLYKEILELDFGKTKSLFRSYSEKLNDSSMQKQLADQFKTASDPDHVAISLTLNGDVSKDIFYTNLTVPPQIYTFKSVASSLFNIKDSQLKLIGKF